MNPHDLARYVEDTGSTWYKPEPSEQPAFMRAASEGTLVCKDGWYTLPSIAEEERIIAVHVAVRSCQKVRKIPNGVIDIFIHQFEKDEKISLDFWQKDAVYNALNSNLFILTGGPGTGKTSVLKCIHFCLARIITTSICYSAPTGKAARRITEGVGQEATTVAKALKLKDDSSIPSPIKEDVMIVDEVSMMDTKTAAKLFSATTGCRLILVGDTDQLASVGYGSVLRDLIDAGVPTTKLVKTFRQASESGLTANILEIKSGLHMGFENRDDFRVHHVRSTSEVFQVMVQEYLKAVSTYGSDQVVCLTPYRRHGSACAIRLNRILQDKLNPLKDQNYVRYIVRETDGFSYSQEIREGDTVMMLENAQVANGDIGTVARIDIDNKTVTVSFRDKQVLYSYSQLGQLTLAYAMSVHKSQGSEYACVITSSIEEDMPILSRNSIYTAVTRAKKECVMITQNDTARYACRRESAYERQTLLSQEIGRQKVKAELLQQL